MLVRSGGANGGFKKLPLALIVAYLIALNFVNTFLLKTAAVAVLGVATLFTVDIF